MSKAFTIILAAAVVLASVGAVALFSADDDYDIVIACGTKNCYEPFWIADEYGFFDDENVKVKMLYVDGGGTAITALLANRADMTLVGADPAIRMFDERTDGMVIATVEISKNAGAVDFAALRSYNVDLTEPRTSLLNTNGTVRVHCGIDITTGYYSGYLSYLYAAMNEGKLTRQEYDLLRTVKTDSKDGGIVHISFDKQVAALLDGRTIQMLCGGNTASLSSEYPSVEVIESPYDSALGCCVIIASGFALAQKSDALTKTLKALDRACAFIQNDDTRYEAAEYCAGFYGAKGWTVESQMKFFNSNYWDICHMEGLESFLNEKAFLLGKEGMDYTDRIIFDYLDAIHSGSYRYDPSTGMIV